jgi:hypothetical protein
MRKSKYIPHLTRGERVRLIGLGHHPKYAGECSIVEILPNPSRNSEHQWYDVRFEDGTYGRFLERYLSQTREIPVEEWRHFFQTFTDGHKDWLVDMQAFDRETGERMAARLLRLKSISAEGEMIVIVGEDDTTEVSELLRVPGLVLVTQDREGGEEGIDIGSNKSLLVLRFRAPVLPETTDSEMICDSLGG